MQAVDIALESKTLADLVAPNVDLVVDIDCVSTGTTLSLSLTGGGLSILSIFMARASSHNGVDPTHVATADPHLLPDPEHTLGKRQAFCSSEVEGPQFIHLSQQLRFQRHNLHYAQCVAVLRSTRIC